MHHISFCPVAYVRRNLSSRVTQPLSSCRFQECRQDDAEQALNYILQGLQADLASKEVVENLFYRARVTEVTFCPGIMANSCMCELCKHASRTTKAELSSTRSNAPSMCTNYLLTVTVDLFPICTDDTYPICPPMKEKGTATMVASHEY